MVPATEGAHSARDVYFTGTNTRGEIRGVCRARVTLALRRRPFFFRRSNIPRARTTPPEPRPRPSAVSGRLNPDPLLRRRPGQGDSVLFYFFSLLLIYATTTYYYYYFPTRIIFVRTYYNYIYIYTWRR